MTYDAILVLSFGGPESREDVLPCLRNVLRGRDVLEARMLALSRAQGRSYVAQLEESCRLVSSALGRTGDTLVYQSRSGPSGQPWLEHDIPDYLRTIKGSGSHPAGSFVHWALPLTTWKCFMTWTRKRHSCAMNSVCP
jgi:protoheme ferro-lyase